MAARLNAAHQADVRLKIKTSQLINRLQGFALGEIDELDSGRIKAIEILLRKSLPDLQQTALTDADGNALTINVRLGGDADRKS